jgi:hypothetical protein
LDIYIYTSHLQPGIISLGQLPFTPISQLPTTRILDGILKRHPFSLPLLDSILLSQSSS